MKKEKVFITLTHKNSLKKGSSTEWEVHEIVEFVNQVRNRHYSYSSCIGDYINRKMITGARHGMSDYDEFEQYVRKKYAKQMNELDEVYGDSRITVESPEVFVDSFGNVREKTVFDA